MEDLAKKFDSFELLMTQALDKLSGLEAWRTSAEAATDKLLSQSEHLATQFQQLEEIPPPPPIARLATAPPQPPPRWTNPFDLNLAPHPVARPPMLTGERPNGHRVDAGHRDAGGGILGSQPPRPVTGMCPHPFPQNDFARHTPLPKLDFPKFDGDNPRLWRDRCEIFFEVYSVGDHLKTRFVALNFTGATASWLQTAERHGRELDWARFCQAVFDRFDRHQYQIQLR